MSGTPRQVRWTAYLPEMPEAPRKVNRRWTETYLPNWRGRKALVHTRDLREAGFGDDFIRRLPRSFSRLPGGKRVSAHVVDRNAVQNLMEQIARAKKLRARAERRLSLASGSASGN